MRLDALLQSAGLPFGERASAPGAVAGVDAVAAALEISAVHADSRRVVPGALFVARDGLRSRGIDFVPAALAAGAAALLVATAEGDLRARAAQPQRAQPQTALSPIGQAGLGWDEATRARLAQTPILTIDAPRQALGPLASASYGHPSRQLQVVAITGTNGKTTTATLLAQLLSASGRPAAALGTLGLWTPEGIEPGGLTTPDVVDLQARLAELVRRGFSTVVLEASSHALDQGRLLGTHIAVAGWTNLSRDHLDYHGDVATYQAAKMRLFTELLPAGCTAWVNADDDAAAAALGLPGVRGFSFAGAAGAAAQVAGLRLSAKGLACRLHVRLDATGAGLRDPAPNGAAAHSMTTLDLSAPLLGRHNAQNLGLAALICRDLGLSDEQITAAARRLAAPRGRLEPVANRLGALILVDYAHTPDALRQVLAVGRELVAPAGKLLVVFGCGGDRDQGKRAPMGQAAGELADVSFATSDNPRHEDPDAILTPVAAGLSAAGAQRVTRLVPSSLAAHAGEAIFCVEPDRDAAIRRAIGLLGPGDVLLIAGKGHETTQTIGDEVRAFDDAAVVRRWLRQRKVRPADAASSATSPAAPSQLGVAPNNRGFAFDAARAAAATGGEVVAASGPAGAATAPTSASTTTHTTASLTTASLTTDSRAVPPGALFVPLVGERFDGHAYLAAAAAQGAAGLLCAAPRAAEFAPLVAADGPWLVAVKDTLVGLGDLARAHRRSFTGPVVCITGSNGKTSTKELTALTLGAAGAVLATYKNHNNRIGVPQTLARLRAAHRFAVVECGMSVPGEIAELGRIAEPDIAVLTNISAAHLEGLGSVEGVAAEKAALLRALGRSGSPGIAIVPADEPLLEPHLAALSCRIVRVGEPGVSGEPGASGAAKADVWVDGPVVVDGLSQRFVAVVCGERVTVRLPAIGVHMVRNALSALAVAQVLGVNLQAAAWALADFQPVGQRMRPLQLGERLILEDCYNANPASMKVALATLATLPGPRVAVLGDMLELGPRAAELHAEVGAAAAAEGIDLLLARGTFAADTVRGARESGLAAAEVVRDDADAAARLAARADATILVKGSRGARMEGVIAALRAHLSATASSAPDPTLAHPAPSTPGAPTTPPEADRAALAL